MATVTRRRRPGGRLLSAVVVGVGAAVVVAALLLAGVVPAVAGARTVAVGTAPAGVSLAPGSLAVVRPQPASVGDVVALVPDPDGVGRLGVVEGSAPSGGHVVTSADGPLIVPGDADLDGVYLYGVPWIGALWTGLGTPSGMFFAAALLLLMVAAHQVHAARRRQHIAPRTPVSGL